MAWTKAPLHIAFLSLALSLDIVATSSFPREAMAANTLAETGDRASTQQIPDNWQTVEPTIPNGNSANTQRPDASWNAFEPPDRGVPGRREGGGTRGPECPTSTTALIPKSTMGRTISANPTFFYYVPATLDKTVEFELADEADKTVYKTSFRMIAKAPGIVSVTLPTANAASLEVGKNYHWYFTIKCNPNDSEADIVVSGWINRVEMTTGLKSQLDGVGSERDRLNIYAKESLWYEYITTLADLRRSQPADSALTVKWTELLSAVELEKIAQQPLVQIQLIPTN
ncbi:DUF928 domain-containing protein [Kamptonema animale CS-326]|jgi:hypothetical protein|uniref:DUF928 domain-containing protein n=1 Tax=Kamptonema animale TaxID=92934 RepID=UPI00232EE320|nr:DUF928 domain-containing protein [Kamptonema animale]MDB9512864.1 DUF928 domain-containing protein [Kamptonema animale CS-326]